MKSPGLVATAFLFRRLIKALAETNKQLARLAEAQELALKLAALKVNMPLSVLRTVEENPLEEVPDGGPGEFIAQSDQDLGFLEKLEQEYYKVHGKPPEDGEDLVELVKSGRFQSSSEQ